MCHELLRDSRFFDALLKFDRDIAAHFRKTRRCVVCGGRLDSAKYARKPRGGPEMLDPDHKLRFSFCCAECRKRATPPSVRFLGPRVYVGPVVVLVSAMVNGVTEKRMAELRDQVSPTLSARTIRRWRVWWREIFVTTPFWKTARARFSPPVDVEDLPTSLLERFGRDARRRLLEVLEFLSPITTRSPMAA